MTPRGRHALLLLCAAAGLLPAAAQAQAQGWAVSVIAGRTLNDPLAARVAASNTSLELRYTGPDERRWAYASGGAPVGSPGPAWGTAGGGALLLRPVGGVLAGLSASSDLYGYAAGSGVPAGGGATAQLAPTLVVARGPVRAELRAGALGTLQQLGDSSAVRVMSDNGARVSWGADGPFQLGAEGRYLRAREGGYTWAGADAALAGARGSVWGFGGRWFAAGFPAPAAGFGAGATLRLARSVDATLAWSQDATDPVYFTAARRTWSAQVTHRFGAGGRRVPAGPRVASIPVLPVAVDDRVEVSVPAADAGDRPSLVGDFTRWQPVPMTRDGDRWTVRLPIAPGSYHYALRAPDGRVFVPASLPQVDDGMGGTAAVLVVR